VTGAYRPDWDQNFVLSCAYIIGMRRPDTGPSKAGHRHQRRPPAGAAGRMKAVAMRGREDSAVSLG